LYGSTTRICGILQPLKLIKQVLLDSNNLPQRAMTTVSRDAFGTLREHEQRLQDLLVAPKIGLLISRDCGGCRVVEARNLITDKVVNKGLKL
jgi:hypothetical protein